MASKKRGGYSLYKFITILMGSLLIPIGTIIGYQLGKGNYTYAILGIIFQTFYVFFQGWLWWKTMEKSEDMHS
ncbi:MAG: hypothetical protein A2798_00715 [Candidatus Levybacteria bacterium RIFCSPHIGHO2_01_FULL_37_17]|nr:MAG: hypothetical protein A2798_00715 [Candidatus Levybacteria bacterium RIFCSPHIGHO2_01_FULL_37_17]OGH36975.1 MAG: hypothetical protein A2959_01575 [Candidatus Levybacteria bacterium RIFCSPLOWO2_01_FULL_38_23]